MPIFNAASIVAVRRRMEEEDNMRKKEQDRLEEIWADIEWKHLQKKLKQNRERFDRLSVNEQKQYIEQINKENEARQQMIREDMMNLIVFSSCIIVVWIFATVAYVIYQYKK